MATGLEFIGRSFANQSLVHNSSRHYGSFKPGQFAIIHPGQSSILVMNKLCQSNGCFQKSWYPQIIHFNRVFHYKPSILGYPYFWKHPNQYNFFIEGITCTSITYNACISACGVGGAWIWAFRLFWQMTMQGTGVLG